jgi:hypothetical protein
MVSLVAHAQDSGDDEVEVSTVRGFKMQIQAGPRYGTQNLHLGLGGRAGLLLGNDVWLGGSFDYFLGVKDAEGPDITEEFRLWNVDAELGYDFAFGHGLSLRPYLGFGLARRQDTVCGPGVNGEMCGPRRAGEWSRPAFKLGGLLMYTTGMVTVSGDVRLLSVVGSNSSAWDSAWVFGAEVGVVF